MEQVRRAETAPDKEVKHRDQIASARHHLIIGDGSDSAGSISRFNQIRVAHPDRTAMKIWRKLHVDCVV